MAAAVVLGLVLGVSGMARADDAFVSLNNGITYSEGARPASLEIDFVPWNGITAFDAETMEAEPDYAAGGPAEVLKPVYNGITIFDSSKMER